MATRPRKYSTPAMASQRQPTKGLFDSTKPLKVPSDSRSTVIQLERTETNRSSKLSRTPSHLSQIPDSSAHLRAGCMQRRFMDTTIVGWSNESLVLTESKLFISKPACAGEEHGQVFDEILLRDVIECELKEDSEDHNQLQVIFRTEETGFNSGRSYIYRSATQDAIDWEAAVDLAVARAKVKHRSDEMRWEHGHSCISMLRARTALVYNSRATQVSVAVLIILGFVLDIVESQLLPKKGSDLQTYFFWGEFGVSVFYTLELSCNVFVHSTDGFRPFYTNMQNWIDSLVVLSSWVVFVLDFYSLETSVPIKMIRVARVVNVAKFFTEFQTMHRIVHSLGYCVYPMANAFFLLLLLTTIYAVLGVHLIGPRNQEFFGDFQHALFSLFQVVSGDSWASSIARGMFVEDMNGVKQTDPMLALYFVSYFVIANIILLNVVIAVLLDEFVTNVEREEEKALNKLERENSKRRITGVLDPITQQLTHFESKENLRMRIDALYDRLDSDGSGGLTFSEFRSGFKNFPEIPNIHITDVDYDAITENGKHLTRTGELTKLNFRDMMKDEFTRYSYRTLANSLTESQNHEFKSTVLLLKMVEMRILEHLDSVVLGSVTVSGNDGDGGDDASEIGGLLADLEERHHQDTSQDRIANRQSDMSHSSVPLAQIQQACRTAVSSALQQFETNITQRQDAFEQRISHKLKAIEDSLQQSRAEIPGQTTHVSDEAYYENLLADFPTLNAVLKR